MDKAYVFTKSSCNIMTSLPCDEQEKMDPHIFTKNVATIKDKNEDVKNVGDIEKTLQDEKKIGQEKREREL